MRRSRPRLLTRRPKHLRGWRRSLVAHKFVSRESCLAHGHTSLERRGHADASISTYLCRTEAQQTKANAVCIDILSFPMCFFWCKLTALVWDSWTTRVNWTCVQVHLREERKYWPLMNNQTQSWWNDLAVSLLKSGETKIDLEVSNCCSTMLPITHYRGWSSKLKTRRQEVHLDHITLPVNSFQVERSPT